MTKSGIFRYVHKNSKLHQLSPHSLTRNIARTTFQRTPQHTTANVTRTSVNVAECYGVLRYASIGTSTPSVLYELLSHTQESESMVAHCYAVLYGCICKIRCSFGSQQFFPNSSLQDIFFADIVNNNWSGWSQV